MGHALFNNAHLRQSVSRIEFHWCGLEADKGIAQLQHCPELSSLSVVVSRDTTRYLNPREKELAVWFGIRRSVQLSDALGFDELVALRGLRAVKVLHVSKTIVRRCTDADRVNLARLLEARLLQGHVGDDANSSN